MAGKIFRRFENERSTTALLEKIISYSTISINNSIKEEALIYLEIRHLIIHNNAKADSNFKEKSQGIIEINKTSNKIKIDFDLVTKAINKTYDLCQEIDQKLIKKNMVTQRFIEFKTTPPMPIG